MKQIKFNSSILMFALGAMLITSCSGNQEKAAEKEKATEVEAPAPVVEEAEDLSKAETIEITINSNDQMQYDKSKITVYEGQTVILTLHHTGTMPVTSMGHNFVLLQMGTSVEDFSLLAMDAKDNDYIPADQKDIIAHTSLIGGGESTTVTFTAPKKGLYDYLCSFPGHHSIMKGKLIVN